MQDIPKADIDDDPNYSLVKPYHQPNFGIFLLYQNKPNFSCTVRKIIRIGQFAKSDHELEILNARVEKLPKTIAPAASDYELTCTSQPFRRVAKDKSVYFKAYGSNLTEFVNWMNLTGTQLTDNDLASLIGYFVLMITDMDSQLLYHPQICQRQGYLFQNRLIFDNPFLNDFAIKDYCDNIVVPISLLGDEWKNEYYTDSRLRKKAADKNVEIGKVNFSFKSSMVNMIQDSFTLILALANRIDDVHYYDPTGIQEISCIQDGVKVDSRGLIVETQILEFRSGLCRNNRNGTFEEENRVKR